MRPLKLDSEDLFCDASKDAIRPIGYVYEGAEHEPPIHRWRSLIERYVNHEVDRTATPSLAAGRSGRAG